MSALRLPCNTKVPVEYPLRAPSACEPGSQAIRYVWLQTRGADASNGAECRRQRFTGGSHG